MNDITYLMLKVYWILIFPVVILLLWFSINTHQLWLYRLSSNFFGIFFE